MAKDYFTVGVKPKRPWEQTTESTMQQTERGERQQPTEKRPAKHPLHNGGTSGSSSNSPKPPSTPCGNSAVPAPGSRRSRACCARRSRSMPGLSPSRNRVALSFPQIARHADAAKFCRCSRCLPGQASRTERRPLFLDSDPRPRPSSQAR